MKIPNKIYLTEHKEDSQRLADEWFPIANTLNDIEYIKKDVFIDKALKWLHENGDYYFTDTSYDLEEMIEDFKQEMEESL